MNTIRVGVEPIVDKNDIIVSYRLLEPLRRPCATCGHEADHRGGDVHAIDQRLFDRWYQVQNELAQVNDQLTRIARPSQYRLHKSGATANLNRYVDETRGYRDAY